MNAELSGPLVQGEIDLYWEEIETTLRKSFCYELSEEKTLSIIAMTQTSIRSGQANVFAIWKANCVCGFAVTGSEITREGKVIIIHAIWSYGGLENEDWAAIAGAFEEIVKSAGYAKIMSYTRSPSILKITELLGWKQAWQCWKDLDDA